MSPDTLVFKEKYAILKWIGCILALLYLANCYTPFRLHIDTMRYFAIKDCIELGCSPDSEAAKDYLPFGYTALLLGLSKAGVLSSFTIVLINCIFLFASLYIICKMFGASLNGYFFSVLVLLNWTIVKFTIHPLSEMQYLFLSIASLYFFNRFIKEKEIFPLLMSFLFAALAFITRTVGITLVAAFVVSLLWEYRKKLIAFILKNKPIFISVLLAVIVVGVFSRQLGLNHYLMVFSKQFNEGVTFSEVLRWHFIEWTEISVNIPFTKVVDYMPSLVKILFLIGGVILFVGTLIILFLRRLEIPFVLSSYLIFYSLLIFNWPFYDPRFWVPILPICVAIIVQTPISFNKSKMLKWGLVTMTVMYSLLGVMSVGYFTYTSFSKSALARTQANGVFRKEYEAAFDARPEQLNTLKADSVVVHLLKRYN